MISTNNILLSFYSLGMCRTCDEVKIFLNQTEGYVGPSSMPYPRLATAMNYGNKLLVSHPQIQFFLQTEFRGPIWKTPRSQFERIAKFVVTALMMLLFPVVQLFLWCSLFCCSDLPAVRYLLSPNNRSLSKLASYIAYCTLLLFMNKEQRYEQGDCVPPTICNVNEFKKNHKSRRGFRVIILISFGRCSLYGRHLHTCLIRRAHTTLYAEPCSISND